MAKKYNFSKLMQHNKKGVTLYFVTYDGNKCLMLAAGPVGSKTAKAEAQQAYKKLLADPEKVLATVITGLPKQQRKHTLH